MKSIRKLIFATAGEQGLTLIEVIISMAIFAIGILAIAGLVIATTKNNTTGNTLTQATMLARAKIEALKTLPLNQLAAACPDDMEPEIVHQIYRQECEVSNLGTTGTIKTIKVTVKWKKSGQLRQVNLQTNTRGLGQ